MNDRCHRIAWRLCWRAVWLLGVHSFGIWLQSEAGQDSPAPQLSTAKRL